ncbi:hypothetical protein WICPIJ_005852 [Wickerhamomyces pijperi]|uniref:RRM domain-containing protein n=1 Tax=Wickerhamomyces pijperi TaxID=599730 RepID=A0A9P8Q376_WICPI|nr:hypothetical protein WICPIJ_005852 [Wickerhamomyces pijperi]
MSATETATSNNRLFVGNIAPGSTKEDIAEVFKDYPVRSINVPTFKYRGVSRGKGYAFIDFDSTKETNLDEVIQKFNEFDFNGKKLYLEFSKPRHVPEKNAEENGEVVEKTESSSEPKKNRRSRRPKGKKEPEVNGDATVEPESATTETTDVTTGSDASNPQKSIKKRRQAKPERVPVEEGVKSKNSLLFRNIPRELYYSEFQQFIFSKDESAKHVSLPTFRPPRSVVKAAKEEGNEVRSRNKGIAFVRFEITKDGETIDQKLEKYNGLEFKERPLQVEVVIETRVKSLDRNSKVVEPEAGSESSAQAAVTEA